MTMQETARRVADRANGDDQPRVYLAGPIQHAADSGTGWRNQLKADYGHAFEFLDPLDNVDATGDVVWLGADETLGQVERLYDIEVTDDTTVVSAADIVEPDKEMIDRADGILLNYPEAVAAWGTPMEMGYVYENRARLGPLPIVFCHGEFRPSPWAIYHADHVTRSPETGLAYLRTVLQ